MELKSLLMRVKILEEDLEFYVDQESDRYMALKQEQYRIEDEEGENGDSDELRSKARDIEFFLDKLAGLRAQLWRAKQSIEVQVELEAEDEAEDEEEEE